MIAENPHLNIPVPFYSAPYSRTNEWISRLFIKTRNRKDNIKLPKLYVYQITSQLKARSATLNRLHTATQEDDEVILLKHMITNRWPNSIKEVPPEIQAYWTFWEELTIEDGLVLKGTRIVLPNNKCKQILILIYEGHLGLGKCKLQCKDTIYWLGINEQLEKLVLNCELCLKYSKAKKQTGSNHVTRTRSSDTSMDESCHWHISLQEWFILTRSWTILADSL